MAGAGASGDREVELDVEGSPEVTIPEAIADAEAAALTEYLPRGVDDPTDRKLAAAVDLLSTAFYPLYLRVLADTPLEAETRTRLTGADVPLTADGYLSAALGAGVVAGATLGAGVAVGLAATSPAITAVAAAIIAPVLAVLGAAAGATTTVGGAVAVPEAIAGRRQREIDLLLPDVVAFMYSLSVGGMSQLEVFDAVARADDVYGEAAVEFQRIARETEYFGRDYQRAIDHVAETTPSDRLSRFLTDLLSIINSGGRMDEFLAEETDHFLAEVQRTQEDQLDSLEFFGEMYLSLSILPMILLIILVVVTLMSGPQRPLLTATVYLLIPFLNLVYLLLVGVVKTDEPGDGRLDHDDPNPTVERGRDDSLVSLPIVSRYAGPDAAPAFERVRTGEAAHRLRSFLDDPFDHFRREPSRTLPVSVPAGAAIVVYAVVSGTATPTPSAVVADPVRTTVWLFHAPAVVAAAPYALAYEWNVRTRGRITDSLTKNLRKLASTNETGQPLLESVRITAADDDSLFASELKTLYKKVQYGQSLGRALVTFNNRYRVPRLTRTINLVRKAQEASDQITPVLKTAARASEVRDEIAAERRSRTRLQVGIVGITFVIFLLVLSVLKLLFVDQLVAIVAESGGGGAAGQQFSASNLDPQFVTTMYFHAVTIHGLCAGLVSGYMQEGSLRPGVKYAVAYLLLGVGVFALIA